MTASTETDLKQTSPRDSLPVALLLLNLGTPDAPDVASVRRYLEQFLMDPLVIDIPGWLRTLLVKGIILNTRPKKSAHAYQSVWTAEGSPLMVNSRHFETQLKAELKTQGAPFALVELAMRYGNPSIQSQLEVIAKNGIQNVVVWPMYPQFADSSTTTALMEVRRVAERMKLRVRDIPAFYKQPLFSDALGFVTDQHWVNAQAEHLLISFHGLPKQHLKRVSPDPSPCVRELPQCCDAITTANQNCYRAQCMATARELARYMNLRPEQWSVSFQSRLGSGWIEPFTDKEIPRLAKLGIRRLAVVCPAFVTDCLETLEEIGIRAHESFLENGGTQFTLIPCLNSEPFWITRAAMIATQFLKSIT